MPQTLETVTSRLYGVGNTVKFEFSPFRPQKRTPFQYR